MRDSFRYKIWPIRERNKSQRWSREKGKKEKEASQVYIGRKETWTHTKKKKESGIEKVVRTARSQATVGRLLLVRRVSFHSLRCWRPLTKWNKALDPALEERRERTLLSGFRPSPFTTALTLSLSFSLSTHRHTLPASLCIYPSFRTIPDEWP